MENKKLDNNLSEVCDSSTYEKYTTYEDKWLYKLSPVLWVKDDSNGYVAEVFGFTLRVFEDTDNTYTAVLSYGLDKRPEIQKLFKTAKEAQKYAVNVLLVRELNKYLSPDSTDGVDISSIFNWFKHAKPNPRITDAMVQIGCHYEEVAEMLDVMRERYSSRDMAALAIRCQRINGGLGVLSVVNDVALLDALCDQIVTAIGVGYMMGYDMAGALSEVNRSNWSKFEHGRPVFDSNGKIKKGKDYKAPAITRFIKRG